MQRDNTPVVDVRKAVFGDEDQVIGARCVALTLGQPAKYDYTYQPCEPYDIEVSGID